MIEGTSVLELNRETHVIRGLSPGSSNILLPIYTSESEHFMLQNETVVVTDTSVDIHKLDPIIATLRLRLDSSPESRLEQGSVTLEVLQGVLFVQEEVVVTASVVLRDGHRSLITDPSELSVSSSNHSIVSVTGNKLLGVSEGEAVINVTWTNAACGVGSRILSTEVAVTVKADISRPTFVPPSQTSTVPEDSPIGHKIVTVTAVVQDDIGNVEESATDIQYRFQNGFNFDSLFSLNPTSGDLVLNGQLDRETTDSYVLLIEATNSAQRRAEQGSTEEGEGEDEVSGSGSGDGGMLTPEPTENTTVSLNIAVLTVSSFQCTSYTLK